MSENRQEDMQLADEIPAKAKGGKLKKFLYLGGIVVVVLACCFGYYFFSQSNNYFSTDNAKVTAKMYQVMPTTNGKLITWDVKTGDVVKQNQVLGRQEVPPAITAPIDGTVIKNDGLANQMATAATPLAVIADTGNLYIGVNIEETNISKIKVSQSVEIKLDAYPKETFSGQVTEIDQATQTYFNGTSSFSTSGTYSKVTQLIPVKVSIDNPDNLPLMFGMNATVKIKLNSKLNNAENQNTEANANQTSDDQPVQSEAVIPNIGGKVAEVRVTAGQRVAQGDPIIVLDSADIQLQVNQAQAAVNAAQTAYNTAAKADSQNTGVTPAKVAKDNAVANYDRMKTLFDNGAIAQVDLDNAKAQMDTAVAQYEAAQLNQQGSLDNASAQVDSARASLAIAQKKLSDCVVRAPIGGTISHLDLQAGDLVTGQSPITTIIKD